MLYYYNKDGVFQKESSKPYKTEKGAVDRLVKEGVGAVFDETGKMIKSMENIQKAPDREPEQSEEKPVQQNEKLEEPDKETHEGEQSEEESKHFNGIPFKVQTTCDSLRIRSGAGRLYSVVGCITEKAGSKTNHLITEEKNGWGRLQNGAGWIALAFTKRVG